MRWLEVERREMRPAARILTVRLALPCLLLVGLLLSGAGSATPGDVSTAPEAGPANRAPQVRAPAVERYTLTTPVVGQGSVGRDPDQADYAPGQVVALTAEPDPGWVFSGWSGDASGTDPSVHVTMTGSLTVTATFSQDRYALVILVAGGGVVGRSPDLPLYTYGDEVELTADPALGWSFSHWSGALTGSDNPKTLTMTGNHSVLATFVVDEYTLTTHVVGHGSVQRDPEQATYLGGDQVEVRAVPVPGWRFTGWSGDLSGTGNPKILTITGDAQVTATFVLTEYTLDVAIVGQGQVTQSPQQSTYHYGDTVTLTAAAAQDWSFNHWSGDAAGSQNPVTIIITRDMQVTAHFEPPRYTLTTQVVGQGSIQRDPNQATYYHGEQVELRAVPAVGWRFTGWSGDLSGSINPKTLTITGDAQVTATFVRIEYSLDVAVVGQGQVKKSPQQQSYHYGDTVTLTASHEPGWAFHHWSGDTGGSQNPKTIIISGDMQVTAHFIERGYALTVQVEGQGSVQRDPTQSSYHYGDEVKLTANPALGWRFVGWSGDLTGSENPKTLTITGDARVIATFARIEYTLTVNVVGQGQVTRSPQQSTYHYADTVTLTAVAVPGWSLDRWSGDASGSENPKTITITANTQVTAHFMREYAIAVTIVGRGKVLFQPNQPTFHLGDRVVLTGWAPLGWQFSSWGGDVSGTQNPVTLVVTGDHQVTATFVADPPGTVYHAHLPWLVEAWPPLPHAPAMLGISNPEGYGDYTVRWGASLWAKTYTLQEARNIAFSGPTQLYQGPLTYYQVSGRGAGRYYYRTKAHNSWGDSGWSSVSRVDVRWEREPNDEPLTQANGPIISGLTYYGSFAVGSDLVDYFAFDLAARHGVQASLTDIPTGHNYDLILEDASLRRVAGSERAGNADETIDTGSLEPGRYYVRVVNASRSASSQSYRLRVVYE